MFTEDTLEGLKEQVRLYHELKEALGSDLDKKTEEGIDRDVKYIKTQIREGYK